MIRSGFGRSRGSDAAGGWTVNDPLALRIVRPFCFTAAKVFARSKKETLGLFLARWAPKNPPTEPAPTISICCMRLLATSTDAYYTTQACMTEVVYNALHSPCRSTTRFVLLVHISPRPARLPY